MQHIPFTLLRFLSFFFLLFVIYGSLVPLEYVYIPLSEAIERFKHIPWLDLGIHKRADWVANFLLFIPVGFFLCGATWSNSRPVRVISSVFIVLFCTLLTVGIEFTQLYFPQRTVSQNDIFAETIGGFIGVAVWWGWGEKLSHFYQQTKQAKGGFQLSEKILYLYLLILFGYSLLPLDLTLSPVEFYNKWKSGNVNFIPFKTYRDTFAEQLYEFATDILIWLPISALYRLSGKTIKDAFIKTISIALLLEFLQLFVYSRTTDITDLFTAAAGALVGILIVFKSSSLVTGDSTPDATALESRTRFQLAGIFFSSLLLVVIFWYPFAFQLDAGLIKERITLFFDSPLSAYYFGTEFTAITSVFHKVLFFIPLAFFVGWYQATSRSELIRTIPGWIVLGLFLLPPLFIELGQLLLPAKHALISDVIFEWLGCFIGYKGFYFIWHRLDPDDNEVAPAPAAPTRLRPSITKTHEGHEANTGRVKHKVSKAGITDLYYSLFPLLGFMAVFWLLVVLLAPAMSLFIHAELNGSLSYLSSWQLLHDTFPVYWATCFATLLLSTSLISLSQKKTSVTAILIWIPVTVMILPVSIFIESLSWMLLLLSTTGGMILSLLLSRFLVKIRLNDTTFLTVTILLLVALLPVNLTFSAIDYSILGGDWTAVGERLYFLLKSLVIYIPFGLILAFSARPRLYGEISFAMMIGFIVITAPFLPGAPGETLINILAFPLGIQTGIWLLNNRKLSYA